MTQSTTATVAARVAAPRLPRVALRSGSVRSDQTLDRLDAALRTAVGALPLRPRPYNEAVRRAERRRIRRARPGTSGPVPGVRVLAYHRVAEAAHDPLAVTPAEFAAHLEAIERSGAEVVTLRRAAELARTAPADDSSPSPSTTATSTRRRSRCRCSSTGAFRQPCS